MVEQSRRNLVAVLIGCLLVTSLVAQSLREEPPEPPFRVLKIRFYTYGTGDFGEVRFASAPGKSQALKLYPGVATEVMDYRGPAVLELFRNGIGADREPTRTTLGRVSIPNNLFEVLVLLVSSSGEESGRLPIRMFACDDSLTGLPVNHLAFLNLTGAILKGWVGETPVRLSAGLSSPVTVEPYFGRRAVLIGLAVQFGDAQRVVLESRTRFYEGRRTFVVILPPEEAGSFDVVAFKIQNLVDASTPLEPLILDVTDPTLSP